MIVLKYRKKDVCTGFCTNDVVHITVGATKCRDDITTFTVSDFQISAEFNFVYCNERIARKKIEAIFK